MSEQVKIIPSSNSNSNQLAFGSLILGLISIPTAFVMFGVLIGLTGIFFGVWHILRQPHGKIMACFGIGLSGFGVILSGCMLFLYIWMFQEMQLNIGSGRQTYENWVGVQAPDITLERVDGSNISLTDLKGKRVILNFWATWCMPCTLELPHLIQLQNEYAGELVIIGISRESAEVQMPFAEEHGINFVLATAENLPEPFAAIRSIPTTFYIDRNGVIQHSTVGYHDYDSIKSIAIQNDFAGEVMDKPQPEGQPD